MKISKLTSFLSLVNRNPRVGGMCLGFVAVLLMFPFFYFTLSDLPFLLDGEIVEARVVTSPTVIKRKFSTCYGFCFAYEDNIGQRRTGKGIAREADLKPGDLVAVRYLRSDSTRSRMETSFQRAWPARLLGTIAVCVFAASVWSGIAGIREVFKSMNANLVSELSETEV